MTAFWILVRMKNCTVPLTGLKAVDWHLTCLSGILPALSEGAVMLIHELQKLLWTGQISLHTHFTHTVYTHYTVSTIHTHQVHIFCTVYTTALACFTAHHTHGHTHTHTRHSHHSRCDAVLSPITLNILQ